MRRCLHRKNAGKCSNACYWDCSKMMNCLAPIEFFRQVLTFKYMSLYRAGKYIPVCTCCPTCPDMRGGPPVRVPRCVDHPLSRYVHSMVDGQLSIIAQNKWIGS